MSTKRSVAIVGGGMGGMAAAFQLMADDPEGYEITVFERDWRLGGKCASGRNLDPMYGSRIEEHGLHILMGFYENVFEILSTCYADLRKTGDLPNSPDGIWWTGVLRGLDTILFAEPPLPASTDWVFWQVPFGANTDPIGGPAQPPPSISELAYQVLLRFKQKLAEGGREIAFALKIDSPSALSAFAETESSRQVFAAAIKKALQGAWDGVQTTPSDPSAYKWFVALYFAGVNLIAMVSDVIWDQDGFRARLDDQDYKSWINKFNCLDLPDRFLSESAPVNAVYDLTFSRGKSFSAGYALYDTLLMLFNYNGHIFYKMLGGMGDTIFAPLYLWLKQRKVQFRFLYDLKEVRLSADQTNVDALVFSVTNPAVNDDYDPLISVACQDDSGNPISLPCWPNQPKSPPLATPREVTERGFDLVVLAMSVGAFAAPRNDGPPLGQNLFVDPAFNSMAHGMVTRGTRAVQLWLSGSLADLGWPPGNRGVTQVDSPGDGPVLGSYKPQAHLNSWADMTQVLNRETWSGTKPQNIAYLCDVYDGPPNDPNGARQSVHDDALTWLQEQADDLWPSTRGGFPWSLLIDPENRSDADRFEAQYWRANVDASEHYVLGAATTGKLRLEPNGTQFKNLFLAGDWVKTDLNAGCVEGAAMAGRASARAIEAAGEPLKGEPVSRPPYSTRDGDLPLEQPVVMSKMNLNGFLFKATRSALQTMLDQTFANTSVSCRAILPLVLVTAVDVQEIRSAVHPEDGFMTERELGFWIPVEVTSAVGTSYAWYIPYLFVDNPAALLAGRELYGFNKILGRFTMGSSDSPIPQQVTAQTLDVLGRNAQVDWRTVAQFTGIANPAASSWTNFAQVAASVAADLIVHLGDPGTVASLVTDGSLFSAGIPLVFLKQFRDVTDGSLTCYRAAVAAKAAIDSVSAGRLSIEGVSLGLPHNDSLDVARTLGMTPSAVPVIGFWARLNAVVGTGVEL